MIIEAGVAAGYVIAWAVRKVKRVGGRLDAETDVVIEAGIDRLHEVVVAKLGGHPALAELAEEAEVAGDASEVSDLTRQQVELALAVAARKDEVFGQSVTELVAMIRKTELAAGGLVITGPVFTGNADPRAGSGGIAVGQVAGNVNINQLPPDPSLPGRPSH